MNELKIRDCEDLEVMKALIREYSQIKGAEICFVSMESELADLKAHYQGGAILLGYVDGEAVASIALRKEDEQNCEVKRLYIKPAYRGRGYAHILMDAVTQRARALGFREMFLSTIPAVMPVAYGMYQRMGFEVVEVDEDVVTMQIAL